MRWAWRQVLHSPGQSGRDCGGDGCFIDPYRSGHCRATNGRYAGRIRPPPRRSSRPGNRSAGGHHHRVHCSSVADSARPGPSRDARPRARRLRATRPPISRRCDLGRRRHQRVPDPRSERRGRRVRRALQRLIGAGRRGRVDRAAVEQRGRDQHAGHDPGRHDDRAWMLLSHHEFDGIHGLDDTRPDLRRRDR